MHTFLLTFIHDKFSMFTVYMCYVGEWHENTYGNIFSGSRVSRVRQC